MERIYIGKTTLDCNGCNFRHNLENATATQVAHLIVLAKAHMLLKPSHIVSMVVGQKSNEPDSIKNNTN